MADFDTAMFEIAGWSIKRSSKQNSDMENQELPGILT
jgi:hypothetical protein